jgi:nucleoside phosphorylase
LTDWQIRDRLTTDVDVVRFGMEAAGLMDSFPCLVIRGIYGFADSHENQAWQPYAAATAAAFPKEFLGAVKTQGLPGFKPASG